MENGLGGMRFRQVSVLVWMALGLSACGGGGNGNVKPAPAYTPPAPGYSPPGSGYAPPTGPGTGGSTPPPTTPPTTPPLTQPPLDAQLSLTNTKAAHDAGFTGTGVTIGVVDSGIMRNHPALAGKVAKEMTYIDPATNNLSVDDVVGHGTMVSEIAAGSAFGKFAGGIAPGATLVSARIISDKAPDDDGSTPPSTVSGQDAVPFGYINQDLINAGVKVMNNSWGGITWNASDTATTKGFHDAYAPFVNGGGLVVFAAGNDSLPNPSTIAALPSMAGAEDLQKGWLAVVALDSSNPTQLASYSNKCGVAMNYCLAAPGNVIVSGKDDTTSNQTYWIVEGTSLSAPIVSGAAAVVWQAFPYFTNDQVRQTLLGTADDLGAPGVDSTFGYGELDVGKAILGPAKFDWGNFDVTLNTNSTWGNAISGSGGLTKDGIGTLTLTQDPTYTGDTFIEHGALVAPSIAGNLYIDHVDAIMSGAHSFGADVQNLGTLVVAGGDVHISGSYYQGFTATDGQTGRLALELGRSLNIDGQAVLAGGNLYVIGAMQGYVANAHTDVLTAKGGLTGQFTGLDVATGVLLSATLNYNSNSAWLNVTQVQASAVNGMTYTTASYGAAQRVDNAFGAINSQLGQGTPPVGGTPVGTDFMHGAASLQQTQTTAALQQSLESLSGQLHAASAAMTFEAIDAGTRALSDHFDGLVDTRTTGGWAQTLGYHGSMSRSGYGDVGYDLSGWMAGQDRRLGSNGVLGFAVSQSQGLGRLAEFADQGQSNAVEGMLYGGVMQDNWYSMGRLGYGTYRENMRRHLELGSDVSGVASDTNGRYTVAYGESGLRSSLGGIQVTPYVNMQYAHIQRDGFNELGGYGFGLKSGEQDVERWQAGLGVRAGHTWSLAGGGSLGLQARAQWQQAFAMHGDVFDASFTGVDQWAPVGGVGLSRYEGQVGLSLDWTMSARSSLQFGMDQYFGQNSQGMMGMLNYRLNF
jgi:autotransporter-associated beta strand protein